MKKPLNISNQKFNKLTAIKYISNKNWLFECECGNKVIKNSSDVKRGKTKSCSRKCTTGNPSKHPLYQTWDGMKKRCYQPNATGYERYGAIGITICDRWLNSFWNFVEDMGNKPKNKTLDRINNNLGYFKENCKWSTKKEQANNRKNNIYIIYNNNKYTLFNICKLLNLIHSTVYYNIKKSNLTPQKYFEKYIFKVKD